MYNYEYVSRKKAKPYRDKIEEIIHEVQDLVRDKFTFRYEFIGSSARNMITYDPKTNVGFDLDVNIEVNDEEEEYSAEDIRIELMNAFKQVIPRYGFNCCENSTRVITIKRIDYFYSKVTFSCDFAVVRNYVDKKEQKSQEYIRFNKNQNSYIWAKQQHPYYLEQKVEWIKENRLWNDVFDLYLYKKNNNLDIHKKSRALYAETIHEICQINGYFES